MRPPDYVREDAFAMLAARNFLHAPPERVTAQMEEEFFSSIRGRNGTYKTTVHQRFSSINRSLAHKLQEGQISTGSVLDIGISSGISTLELYDDIRACGYDTHIVGTDVLIDAYMVRVGTGCYALIDETGFPLRFDVFGRGMKPWVTSADYRTGMFVFRKMVNITFTHRARRLLGVAERQPGGERVRSVRLVTPRLGGARDIAIQADDIGKFNPAFSGRFDFIRAANIFNKGYFQPPVLERMIGNVRAYLKAPGASLLVVRTHEDQVNHGTLFRLSDDRRFAVLDRFGEGSEVEDIVLRAGS
jgi:hypothetical protein